jgi:myo-inositol-1(or 4)-monophosphatase
MRSWTPDLKVAEQAARAGGAVVARYFREGVAMRDKAQSNLVSDADVESEYAIADVIRHAFPGHEILGEEAHAGDLTADHLWVVDPLDGTNNFAHGVPQFAVSVAYYFRGVAKSGAIYDPVRDEMYLATAGEGATFNGEPVHASLATSLGDVLVGVGFYYDRGVMMEATLAAVGDLKRDHKIHGIRRFGAATLDLCMVGLGRLGAYFEFTLSPWDFAAGRLFVEEAGGRVTDCRGQPLPLARSSILATNGGLHDAMLEVVRRRLPEGF